MRLFIYLLPFALFFTSCAKKERWEEASIRNRNSLHDLAKLSHPPSNPLYGIELELIRSGDTLFGYLNVHQFEITPRGQDPSKAQVEFIAGETTRSFLLDRLEGGQRLRLSEEALRALTSLLREGTNLTIRCPPFSETIEAKEFPKYLSRLLKKPSPYLPEKLISFDLY